MVKSVEPQVAQLFNEQLNNYKLDYKLEQDSLNSEIDSSLNEYFSKQGGTGGNRPDVKLILQDKNLNYYPVLIEYKGYKNKLEKKDDNGKIDNQKKDHTPNYNNINHFAVNGAIHYANALLHYTNYRNIISIGITGYKDKMGKLRTELGAYFVSKSNLGVGQKIGEFSDLSFLNKDNFNNTIDKIQNLNLTEKEINDIKIQKEQEIDYSLKKLNNDIYEKEKGLSEQDRVYLVAGTVMATLGVPGMVTPLEKSDLKSSNEEGNSDGDILMRKISNFLKKKNLPPKKMNSIIRSLENTITSDNINQIENGESQLKRVFSKIVDDLGYYYKIGLTTDFTGKLFNEMYSWLGFTKDKLNDVVLTPSYVAKLLAKLARVNRNSYVWDFATGSSGLLVAAMNEMLLDAKENITSPDEFRLKENKIKSEQLLGIELLPNVYMLAVLNMILMGDGSSNILNEDSLRDFNGNYGYTKENTKFPANAFLLNPPYSAPGNGMIFVKRALSMMNSGYAAFIIQNSAGSGQATDFNIDILKSNTLLASIKMPVDIFGGKSSVQTYIYVFRVGEAHDKDSIVKFIDFSNDGYKRTNRKKASTNLLDIDNAHERYQEIVDLVKFGKKKLNIFTNNEYYEGTIDPNNGNDWNQSIPVDVKPSEKDFTKVVGEYISWEVDQLMNKEI